MWGDIIQFGDVQRGYLGISYLPTDGLNDEQIKSLGVPTNIEGVYVQTYQQTEVLTLPV